MKQRKTGNAERRNELSDRLHEVTQRANQVYEDASRGARSIPELLRERRLLQTEIAGLEQLIESVEVSEAMIARIEADPAAYMDDFYARFPGLADRRPRLDIALAQDRTNRRIS